MPEKWYSWRIDRAENMIQFRLIILVRSGGEIHFQIHFPFQESSQWKLVGTWVNRITKHFKTAFAPPTFGKFLKAVWTIWKLFEPFELLEVQILNFKASMVSWGQAYGHTMPLINRFIKYQIWSKKLWNIIILWFEEDRCRTTPGRSSRSQDYYWWTFDFWWSAWWLQ